MEVHNLIGSKLPRIDGPPKVLGQALYTDDIKLPDMLYARILGSPYAHAKILEIDISRAKTLPGVKAVVTGKDFPKVFYERIYTFSDRYPLAVDKVRHFEEGVAAVAAIDEETAEEALQLIKVEYEPLPTVFDPLEAVKPGAPLIHEAHKNNISFKMTRTIGDIEKAFEEADYVREDTFRTAPQNNAALECHSCISKWEHDGSLTHWATTQAPFWLQQDLAEMLGLEANKVRVIQPTIGGAFGGRTRAHPFSIISAQLSRITGKPVKITLSREEVFNATLQRHPMILTLRTGVKKDGTLICLSLKLIADGGAYAGSGMVALLVAHKALLMPYKLKSYHYDAIRAITNKPIGGPYQGHGAPQVRFATECQLDMIAKELQLDPLDMRLKNFVHVGYEHLEKHSILSCGLKECLDFIEKGLNWRERKGKLPAGRGLGIAFSAGSSGGTPMPHSPTGTAIRINMDGGVNIFSGASDIGQGMDTVVCQIVAQELGIGMKDVSLIRGDTAITPFDRGAWAPGGAMRIGNAALAAAREVKKKLLEVIAPKFEASHEDIEFSNGKVYIRGNYNRGIDFKEAVRIYRYTGKNMPLLVTGYYDPEGTNSDVAEREAGISSSAFSFLGAGFEVEVDRETGKVNIIKAVLADDLGRVINKLGQEGALEGALSRGIGMAIYEDLPHEEGRYINSSFLGYPLLTALDEPQEVIWTNIETMEPAGPFGAKASGEQAKSQMAPALANAICDATGVRIKELPITPIKILKALEEREEL